MARIPSPNRLICVTLGRVLYHNDNREFVFQKSHYIYHSILLVDPNDKWLLKPRRLCDVLQLLCQACQLNAIYIRSVKILSRSERCGVGGMTHTLNISSYQNYISHIVLFYHHPNFWGNAESLEPDHNHLPNKPTDNMP